MNPFEFVLAVLILVFTFTIIRHKLGIPVRSMREMRGDAPPNDEENSRLRGQVKQLQDRIHVLERIVTDRGVETAAQIEALRDRDKLARFSGPTWIKPHRGLSISAISKNATERTNGRTVRRKVRLSIKSVTNHDVGTTAIIAIRLHADTGIRFHHAAWV